MCVNKSSDYVEGNSAVVITTTRQRYRHIPATTILLPVNSGSKSW